MKKAFGWTLLICAEHITILSFIRVHFLTDIHGEWFLFPTDKLVARCCSNARVKPVQGWGSGTRCSFDSPRWFLSRALGQGAV